MAGRGLFPACFAAQSRAPCHISSLLGHREDLQSSFCPGRGFFFCCDSQKGGEATRPFCARESVFS